MSSGDVAIIFPSSFFIRFLCSANSQLKSKAGPQLTHNEFITPQLMQAAPGQHL